MRSIVAALRRCWEARQPCVMATIIRVEGSAYRREGARCLIHVDGQIAGILSGGCLEEDLREQARTVFENTVPKQLTYDFRAGEDDLWGVGQGCNGAVSIWLELFDPVRQPEAAAAILADSEARLTCEVPYWALTVLAVDDGGRYRRGGRLRVPVDDQQAGPKAGNGICTFVVDGARIEVFAERVQPEPRLYIIGVGADAELLSRLAALLAWPATIVYHRASRAEQTLFPAAERVLHVPRGDFSSLGHLPGGYAVVMTHHLELDQEAVRQLLPMNGIVYVGLLGSRSRIQSIVRYAAAASGFRAERLHKLHAPIGLDLGGGTPESISLSIMAELMAHRNGKPGGSLRNIDMLTNAAKEAAEPLAVESVPEGGEERVVASQSPATRDGGTPE